MKGSLICVAEHICGRSGEAGGGSTGSRVAGRELAISAGLVQAALPPGVPPVSPLPSRPLAGVGAALWWSSHASSPPPWITPGGVNIATGRVSGAA